MEKQTLSIQFFGSFRDSVLNSEHISTYDGAHV